jgi:hypothetical protein
MSKEKNRNKRNEERTCDFAHGDDATPVKRNARADLPRTLRDPNEPWEPCERGEPLSPRPLSSFGGSPSRPSTSPDRSTAAAALAACAACSDERRRRAPARAASRGDAPTPRGDAPPPRFPPLLLISSNMLEGASQIVSMIRVKCNGT